MDEEETGLRRAWLGHLFTCRCHEFWNAVGDVTSDTRQGFVELGIRYSPVQTEMSPHSIDSRNATSVTLDKPSCGKNIITTKANAKAKTKAIHFVDSFAVVVTCRSEMIS